MTPHEHDLSNLLSSSPFSLHLALLLAATDENSIITRYQVAPQAPGVPTRISVWLEGAADPAHFTTQQPLLDFLKLHRSEEPPPLPSERTLPGEKWRGTELLRWTRLIVDEYGRYMRDGIYLSPLLKRMSDWQGGLDLLTINPKRVVSMIEAAEAGTVDERPDRAHPKRTYSVLVLDTAHPLVYRSMHGDWDDLIPEDA